MTAMTDADANRLAALRSGRTGGRAAITTLAVTLPFAGAS
jgi:hypothetical protein